MQIENLNLLRGVFPVYKFGQLKRNIEPMIKAAPDWYKEKYFPDGRITCETLGAAKIYLPSHYPCLVQIYHSTDQHMSGLTINIYHHNENDIDQAIKTLEEARELLKSGIKKERPRSRFKGYYERIRRAMPEEVDEK